VASGTVGGVIFTSVFRPSRQTKIPQQWEALQIIKSRDTLLARGQPKEAGVL